MGLRVRGNNRRLGDTFPWGGGGLTTMVKKVNWYLEKIRENMYTWNLCRKGAGHTEAIFA